MKAGKGKANFTLEEAIKTWKKRGGKVKVYLVGTFLLFL